MHMCAFMLQRYKLNPSAQPFGSPVCSPFSLPVHFSSPFSLTVPLKVSQWELQRLSVVLMLESMLPCQCLMYNSGRPMHVARFDLRRKQMIQEVRYFTKVMHSCAARTSSCAVLSTGV